MRIIGGIAGGTLLKVPKGLDVRPTPDLVRQAIFNRLADQLDQARILELFGGTAALSLECLSRGAATALCVEIAQRPAQLIRQNLAATRIPPQQFQLRIQDAFIALSQLHQQNQTFDFILADPPYGPKNNQKRSESFAQRLLDNEHLPHLLAPGGTFVLGHARRDTLTLPGTWEEQKQMKHGDSIFRFLLKADIPTTSQRG